MTNEPIDLDAIQAMWDSDQDVEIFVPDLISALRTQRKVADTFKQCLTDTYRPHVTERDMLRKATVHQGHEIERLEAILARVKDLAYNPDTGDMYADSAIVVDATVLQNALQEKS